MRFPAQGGGIGLLVWVNVSLGYSRDPTSLVMLMLYTVSTCVT